MFRQFSHRNAGFKLLHKNLLLLMISAAMLAFPLTSSLAQVIRSSPPCIRGLNNQRAICTGWVVCDSAYFTTTVYGSMSVYQACPGYTVHNYAAVYKLVNSTGIGADGQTHLYSGGGPTLTFRYTPRCRVRELRR